MSGSAALAVLRQDAHVSVSSVTAFRCPEQYRHRYILHTRPAHRPAALPFGGAVHEALGLFYTRLMKGEPEPTIEELATSFLDAWSRELKAPVPVLFDEGDNADSLRNKGAAMLRVFHAEAARPHRVVGVEEAFSIEIVDPITNEVMPERLVGAFDAVVQDAADGPYRILEHKTAARRYTDDKLRFDLQPSAYSLAAPLVGLGEVTVTYQVLLKTKTPALVRYELTRTERDRRDFLRTVTGVLSAIRAEAFYPVRDWWCQSCAFAGPCLAG